MGDGEAGRSRIPSGSCQPFASLRGEWGIRGKPFGVFVNLFLYIPLRQQLGSRWQGEGQASEHAGTGAGACAGLGTVTVTSLR